MHGSRALALDHLRASQSHNPQTENDMYTYLTQQPDHTSPASRHASAQRRPSRLQLSIWPWLQAAGRRWKQRKMIAALEALDDRLLDDIGLARGDIRKAVLEFDDRELKMRPLAPSISQHHRQNDRHMLAT